MVLICVGLLVLVAALCYRNKRDNDIVSDTIGYYSNLASELSNQLKNHRDLTSFLAHDLKSPLAGIISSAQALEQAGQSLPDPYIDCLRLMQASGRANLRLLSNFIELIGDASSGETQHSIPDNRLDLLSGLIDSRLLREERIIWHSSHWLFKTNIPLRTFSSAMAEIVSILCTENDFKLSNNKLRIEESFDPAQKQLRVTFKGLDRSFEEEKKQGFYPYTIAMSVLEKIGVSIVRVDQSEGGTVVELLLPVCEYVAMNIEEKTQHDSSIANAEALIEQSLKQVRMATLSVGTLSSLQMSKDEVEDWIEQLENRKVKEDSELRS